MKHDEDSLEQLFWDFDTVSKRSGDIRLSFKGAVRKYAALLARHHMSEFLTESETGVYETWKNPLYSPVENLAIADGTVDFWQKTAENRQQRLDMIAKETRERCAAVCLAKHANGNYVSDTREECAAAILDDDNFLE